MRWILYILVCIYALMDSFHTLTWLYVGGTEGNPAINYLINITTIPFGLFAPKVIFLALLGVVVYLTERRKPQC